MPATPAPKAPAAAKRVADTAIVCIYVVLLGGLVLGLVVARQALIAQDASQSQSDWEEWRSEAKSQSEGQGPVERRIPRSAEPPTLVLLRDHFFTSTATLIVLSSALYFAFALMVRGALTGPTFELDSLDDEQRD